MAADLSLLFTLKAKNEASNELKSLERQIASLKDRIKEIKTETDVPFKTQRIDALKNDLAALTARHKELKTAAADTQKAHQDLAGAVGTLSPRLGALTGSLTGVVGPATAVAVGLAAIGAAGVALFELTKTAADFQGKMFDMAQQTGISVETLSTLDVVAKTTGGSIEGITASLGIFQKKLEDALDPTSKESALLQQLGIDTNNTEESLRQALTVLSQMPEGFRQTATALELFGRGGKSILAILKEMDGDLDGATKKFRAMGILISTDAARAADKFNDQLALLGFQIRSVTAIVGNEAMPTILSALTSISKAFEDNQSTITAWVNSTADAARGALILADAVKTIGTQVTGLSNLPVPTIIKLLGSISGATAILEGLQKLGVPEIGALPIPGLTTPLRESTATPGTVIDLSKAGKAAKEAQQRANREIALALQELEEITRVNRIALERERDLDLKTIEEWEKESTDAASNRLAQQQIIFDQERDAARRFIKNKQDLALAIKEINQKDEKAQNDFFINIQKIQDDARKRSNQVALATERQLAEILDSARRIELAKVKDFVDRGIITESEGIARTLALLKDEQAQRLLLIDIELKQETTSAARKQELDNEKIKSEQKYTDEVVRLVEERNRAREKEEFEEGKRPGGGPQGEEIDFFKDIGRKIEEDIGPPPLPPGFDVWKDAFKELKNIGRDALDSLAFGVGSLVQNWVLLGETGPKAMRKLVASVLAGVAAQAAVKAVYELAEGFAALFVNPPAAAAHFTSAAIFGSIAGVAAVAGRAIAGDAFQRNAGDKGGSGGRGSGGSSISQSDRRDPIDLIRNPPQPQILILRVESNDSHILNVIQQDVNRNGGLRNLIIETAGN